ncbi:hypothetical protein SuUB92_15080 [Streptococcus uberis]|uniref:TIR domain-containing protein n=1 Tax=Streptococcus uberis TaxID=1349 RepID=UPI0020BDB483|nr:TIR domain-containing protein [Streptococcus uberis]
MEKPIIFISHITEEGEVAKRLKADILKYYRESVLVFVSSDFDSIEGGKDYFNTIIDRLRKTILMITLCSPESVKREWINFETGFGYARKINVLPLLYKGLKFSDIQSPIQRMQGYDISDESLNNIFRIIDEKLDYKNEHYDFTNFLNFVSKFEKEDKSLLNFMNNLENILGTQKLKDTLLYEIDDERAMINISQDKYKKLDEMVFESGYSNELQFINKGSAGNGLSGLIIAGFYIKYSDLLYERLSEKFLRD